MLGREQAAQLGLAHARLPLLSAEAQGVLTGLGSDTAVLHFMGQFYVHTTNLQALLHLYL